MTEGNINRINELIAVHGEGGAAPSRSDWEAIFAIGDAPLQITNLLKFKSEVEFNGEMVPGLTAYQNYMSGNASAFQRVGGKRLYLGLVHSAFGHNTDTDWDLVIVTQYPSADALANMWLDEEFLEAHEYRDRCIERSCVLVVKT